MPSLAQTSHAPTSPTELWQRAPPSNVTIKPHHQTPPRNRRRYARHPVPPVQRRSIHLPAPGTKRAVVIGAGSFGTAVAVLLARGGLRTTLQTRTPQQADELAERPRESRRTCRTSSCHGSCGSSPSKPASRARTMSSWAFPPTGLDEVIDELQAHGLPPKAAVISLAKGLVPPDGTPPTANS